MAIEDNPGYAKPEDVYQEIVSLNSNNHIIVTKKALSNLLDKRSEDFQNLLYDDVEEEHKKQVFNKFVESVKKQIEDINEYDDLDNCFKCQSCNNVLIRTGRIITHKSGNFFYYYCLKCMKSYKVSSRRGARYIMDGSEGETVEEIKGPCFVSGRE